MIPSHGPADSARRAVRAQQQRQTGINLIILLGLGAAASMLAMEGLFPVDLTIPGPGRFAIETAGYVLLFDAYFYVLHRLLHTPLAFRRVHAVHHRAREVDVWSTIAMHPLEFLLLVGFVPVTMFLLPVHLVSVLVVSLFLSASIALAHSGRQVFPRHWERTPLVNLYLTPRIHEAHHVRLNCNYGGTVTIFDRLFGTLGTSPEIQAQ